MCFFVFGVFFVVLGLFVFFVFLGGCFVCLFYYYYFVGGFSLSFLLVFFFNYYYNYFLFYVGISIILCI